MTFYQLASVKPATYDATPVQQAYKAPSPPETCQRAVPLCGAEAQLFNAYEERKKAAISVLQQGKQQRVKTGWTKWCLWPKYVVCLRNNDAMHSYKTRSGVDADGIRPDDSDEMKEVHNSLVSLLTTRSF